MEIFAPWPALAARYGLKPSYQHFDERNFQGGIVSLKIKLSGLWRIYVTTDARPGGRNWQRAEDGWFRYGKTLPRAECLLGQFIKGGNA